MPKSDKQGTRTERLFATILLLQKQAANDFKGLGRAL